MTKFLSNKKMEIKWSNISVRNIWITLFLSVLCVSFIPSVLANVVGNPSFEEPLGNGSAGNWDDTNLVTRVVRGTANYPGASSLVPALTFSPPPNGIAAILFDEDIAGSMFTFQTNDNIKPGDFVSFSARAESDFRLGATVQLKIEFKRVLSNGTDELIKESDVSDPIAFGSAQPGIGFPQFIASGVAPEGTGRVVFTIERNYVDDPAFSTKTLVDEVVAEINPAKLTATASKNSAKAGDAVGIMINFNNASAQNYNNVDLIANIPHGLDVDMESVRINGQRANAREGSLIIPVGTLGAGEQFNATFLALVTSGVELGKDYEIDIIVSDNNTLSERARIRITIEGDPVFTEGTIIGKVFNDLNQNTVQDCGEEGVPWVRIVTEEGIVITTDEHGRYHLPAVKPGRHVLKIDGHTLPEGTEFISEEAYLVKTTDGILSKANFAVLLPPSFIAREFQDDLSVTITQGLDTSTPKLDIQMSPDLVKLGIGVLEKPSVFKLDLNYPEIVKKWSLEIRDEMGREVWTGYGISEPPPEVVWEGLTETGLLIKPGIYSYQFKVRDVQDREDWTMLKFFRVISKMDRKGKKNYKVEIPPVGDFNIFKDGKRSIPLVAKPTIRVMGKTRPENKVTVNQMPVPVNSTNGLFQKEFYVEAGRHEFIVASTTPDGETIIYREEMTVKDSMFFMVALGEQEGGLNFTKGQIDTTGRDDKYVDGFYQDGRLSYYLKGKLKGKFLIKSHYDTDEERSALFTNLDPDDYYPVYGDNSTRDYDAQDTRQRFYFLMEMDRSFIKWGSYKTEFNETELSTYNRTLSGFKMHYETLLSTVYGDPVRELDVFLSKSDHIADHNELAATGGTLYYTRYNNIIEGSEKIRVEVRDKIQDMVIYSYDLREGTDYELDYDQGRILLSRPLSSVVASDTLISSDLLDGNPVFLVVDYEYDIGFINTDTPNRGIRAYTHMGDHVRIGATAIEEKREGGEDYDMRGVDLRLKIGRNTKITAEYAETKLSQNRQAVSYDGGISYAGLGHLRGQNTRPRENAYLIKAETKPTEKLEISGFVQAVEPGFSNGHMRAQEGMKKYGLATNYKFTDDLSARYRFDSSEVVGQLLPLDEHGIIAPFEKLHAHTAQIIYDDGKYLAQAEYMYKKTDVPDSDNLFPTIDNEIPFDNGLSLKVGQYVNDRLMAYAKGQTTMKGKGNHQLGGGVRYEVMNNIFAYLEQMFGKVGDSTYFGFEKQHENGNSTYANLKMLDRGIGTRTLRTAVGSSYSLSEKTRMISEREYSSFNGEDGFADILGIEGKAGDRWDYGAKYERRHLQNVTTRFLAQAAEAALARTNTFNTLSGHLAYADGKKLKARTYMEWRRDQDVPKMWQVVTRNSIEYKLNEDMSFLGKLNYGVTRERDPGDWPAGFMEFSTGLAFRPVAHDKLNVLARYTYTNNLANDMQFNNSYYGGLEFDERSHVFSVDTAYDINRYFGIVEKFAIRRSHVALSSGTEASTSTFLWVNRVNYHVTRKWDVALEYRMLWQAEALATMKQGALIEIDREFYEYVRIGVGYNFTDFNDDLRTTNEFQSHGPFVRLTGKF